MLFRSKIELATGQVVELECTGRAVVGPLRRVPEQGSSDAWFTADSNNHAFRQWLWLPDGTGHEYTSKIRRVLLTLELRHDVPHAFVYKTNDGPQVWVVDRDLGDTFELRGPDATSREVSLAGEYLDDDFDFVEPIAVLHHKGALPVIVPKEPPVKTAAEAFEALRDIEDPKIAFGMPVSGVYNVQVELGTRYMEFNNVPGSTAQALMWSIDTAINSDAVHLVQLNDGAGKLTVVRKDDVVKYSVVKVDE